MNEVAVLEINSILELINSTRLTENEIIRLDKAGEAPVDNCGYYETTATLLGWRMEYDTNASAQFDLMISFASSEGCSIIKPEVPVVDVNIPMFAGGL